MQVINAGMSLTQINAVMAARLMANEEQVTATAAEPKKSEDRMALTYGDEHTVCNVFEGLFRTEEVVISAAAVTEPTTSGSVPEVVIPVESKGSTRVELRVTDESGNSSLLASVDSATSPGVVPTREQGQIIDQGNDEVSLEDKIREAAAKSGIVIPENESPLATALRNASKGNVRRNNAQRNK